MAANIYQPAEVKVANEVTAALVAIVALLPQVDNAVNSYSDNVVSAALHAMATAPLNADGTLGTADATPVAGNPIDPRVVPNFSQVQSAYNYDAGYALLVQFQNLFKGLAVTTTPTAPNIITDFAP
jgi:hypothetical protein